MSQSSDFRTFFFGQGERESGGRGGKGERGEDGKRGKGSKGRGDGRMGERGKGEGGRERERESKECEGGPWGAHNQCCLWPPRWAV